MGGTPPTVSYATERSPNGKRQAARHPVTVQGEGSIIGTVPRGDTTGDTTPELVRYSSRSYPLPGFRGDMEYSALYAGESCSLIHDIKPAAQIVCDLVREADEVIEQMLPK